MIRFVQSVGLGWLVTSAAAAQGAEVSPLPEAEIAWHASLDAAREAAATSGKPVLALFRCEP